MARTASLGPDDCNCLAARQAARHITQFYDQYLVSSGLRTTQFSILAKLRRLGPMTINRLAAEMVMDRTTLGRNILPLERDGLIRVAASVGDGRAKEVYLTKVGEKRLHAGIDAWSQAQARFESAFGAKRAADLRGLLGAVVASEMGARANN